MGNGQGVQVCTGLGEGLPRGVQNGVAGDCGTADGIHIGGLVLQNGLLQQSDGKRADILCLIAAVDLHIGDLVVGDRQSNRAVTAEAFGGLGVGTGDKKAAFRRGVDHRRTGAGGLCQSLGHGVLHGIGGQRRAGDTVDLGTLGREHLLPQGGQSLTAQGGGLIGTIQLHFVNAAAGADG